jgi:hypothetical protein
VHNKVGSSPSRTCDGAAVMSEAAALARPMRSLVVPRWSRYGVTLG